MYAIVANETDIDDNHPEEPHRLSQQLLCAFVLAGEKHNTLDNQISALCHNQRHKQLMIPRRCLYNLYIGFDVPLRSAEAATLCWGWNCHSGIRHFEMKSTPTQEEEKGEIIYNLS
jgi:hypothetical protein